MNLGMLLLAMAVLAAAWILLTGMVDALRTLRPQGQMLVAFSPTVDDAALLRQRQVLDALGLDEALVFVEVVGNGRVEATGAALSGPTGEALRARFGVEAAEFAVVLVDKSGQPRLVSNRPLTFQELAPFLPTLTVAMGEASNA